MRDLVLRYGWNTLAYQILNPGIAHWFQPGGEGVVGYVDGHVVAAHHRGGLGRAHGLGHHDLSRASRGGLRRGCTSRR